MQKMQNKRQQEDTLSPSVTTPDVLSPAENDHASPLPVKASTVIPPAAPAAGGVKKKKPKKKK